MRPSWASLAISQSTIAEMLQGSLRSSRVSRGRRVPTTAQRRTCVSTFSIPLDTGGEYFTLDPKLALERADQLGRVGAKRNKLGHRLATLRDHDSVRIHAIEQRQAL